MESKIILTTELQLKAIVADAVNAAFTYRQLPTSVDVKPLREFATKTLVVSGKYIDFEGLRGEYYPGIPASTVRQKIATLTRDRKEGKRIIFKREDVENFINNKRLGKHE